MCVYAVDDDFVATQNGVTLKLVSAVTYVHIAHHDTLLEVVVVVHLCVNDTTQQQNKKKLQITKLQSTNDNTKCCQSEGKTLCKV